MNLSSWLFGVLFAEPQKARLNQQTKHVEVLGDCLSDAGSIPAVSTKLNPNNSKSKFQQLTGIWIFY